MKIKSLSDGLRILGAWQGVTRDMTPLRPEERRCVYAALGLLLDALEAAPPGQHIDEATMKRIIDTLGVPEPASVSS